MKATEVTAGLAESNGSLLPGLWCDSLHVTCGLTACTPGSAPGPTLGNEYGKTLPFTSLYSCLVVGLQCRMADLHGYPFFERVTAVSDIVGIDVLPVEKFPRLTGWMSAMQRQEFVKKVWMSTKMHQHYLAGYLTGCPDYDIELDEETVALHNSVT